MYFSIKLGLFFEKDFFEVWQWVIISAYSIKDVEYNNQKKKAYTLCRFYFTERFSKWL